MRCYDPVRRWELPSVTISAEMKCCLTLNTLRYVDSEFYTVIAQGVRRVCAIDRCTTITAKNTGNMSTIVNKETIELLTSHLFEESLGKSQLTSAYPDPW
jgi:hypothetical protein